MRLVLPAVAAFVVMSSAVPARAQTCTPFTDVGANDPFCTSIQWLFNRGVTQGCTAAQYCPGQFVRRDQMAAFLSRLADKTVFQQGGNAFGAAARLGTADDEALDVIVNSSRVMRYEPRPVSPNVIGGHPGNAVTAGARGATIGGGGKDQFGPVLNRVTDDYGTVGGGAGNRAGNDNDNVTDALHATVGGGLGNVAGGYESTVGGGLSNTAIGWGSTVPGGRANVASGFASFAAGSNARATGNGSFIWADARGQVFEFLDDNLFGVRATGGVNFTTKINSAGLGTNLCRLDPNQVGWICSSDRDSKENFEPARGEEVLESLAAMPLYSYTLKGAEPSLRHLGPTAQDFHAAFRLGADTKTIATNNMHGVALAAIQGLNAKVVTQARAIDDLRRMVEQLHRKRGVRPDARRPQPNDRR